MQLLQKLKNKKSIISSIIGITMLFLFLLGTTYAYFKTQVNGNGSLDTNIKTGTTDHLVFQMGEGINIDADITNFAEDMKNLEDETTASAILTANDATNHAKENYNIFLMIEENDFEYTTEDGKAEIILNVTDPLGHEVEDIPGLKKVEGGFDITKRHGDFLIISDYDIEANENPTTQSWTIKVTLVNLNENQNLNQGKHLSGQLYMTKEEISTYSFASITNSEVDKTYSTIDFTPTVNEGTEKVAKYFYAIEPKNNQIARSVRSISVETVKYEESDKGTYEFKGLKPETEYTIYSYVEDAEGFKSNVYQTEVTTNEYRIPIINSVTFESGLYSIKATVDAIGRDGEITTYHYYKDGELVTSIPEAEYTYEGLSDTSEYDLKIEVEDNNGAKSTAYEERVSTKEYIYPEIESIDVSNESWNKATLTTNVKAGSTNEVVEYSYQVKHGDKVIQEWFVGSKTQVIENLEPNQEYTVEVKVKDSEGRESKKVYTQNITTSEYKKVELKVETSKTNNSITIDVTGTNGDGTITRYMYSNNGGESWEEFPTTELKHSYTFESLTSDTEFDIWVKAVDSNNKESDIYKEKVTTDYIEPTAQSVVLTKVTASQVTATLNATKGSREFANYYFKINDGEEQVSKSNTYTFDVGATGNIKVEAYAKDTKDHATNKVSTSYTNPSVSKIEITETPNGTTIKTKATVTKGTAAIKTYYFRTDEDEAQQITSSELTASATIGNINKNKAFNVKVYVEDENGRRSNEAVTGVNQVTVNFNENGNTVNKAKESCFIKTGEENCEITTAKITANSNTPTIIGFSKSATDHSKVVGSEEELTLTANMNGTTYYAQTQKDAVIRKITFNPNGNTSFTYNGAKQTVTKEYDLCTIGATYNGVAQGTSCNATITFPTIEAHGNTPTIIGWSNGATNRTKAYNSGQASVALTATGNLTYYAQTQKDAVIRKITFNPNGNPSFTYNSAKQTTTKEYDLCTIGVTYNGVAQGTSCSATITFPTIQAHGNTPTVIGWSDSATNRTKAYNSGQASVALTASGNLTYYAQTRRDAADVTITFNKNGAKSQTDTSGAKQTTDTVTRTCKKAETWNGVAQSGCSITSPTIEGSDNTPTVVGYNTNKDGHTSTWSHNTAATVTTNATYFAQTKRDAANVTITFNKNGAKNQTDASGTKQTTDTVTRTCTKAATWNGVAQSGCSITSPTIEGSSNTPTVIGYNTNKDAHTSTWTQDTATTVTTATTYFAQTTKAAVIRKITFNPNGNTSFTYKGAKQTVTKEYDLCTIGATYNGVAQATSCNATITFPTIQAHGNTPTVIGWSDSATNRTKAYNSGQASVALTATGNLTYYAQTQKDAVIRKITFNPNGNPSFTYNSAKQTTTKEYDLCTIGVTYNGVAQGTSCNATITFPTIQAHGNTPTIIGWSDSATNRTKAYNSGQASVALTATGNLTYYAQTRRDAADVTITFNKNGAKSQTDTSGAKQTTDTVTRTCKKAETWNGVAQSGCSITSPTIEGSDNTPTVVGYNTNKDGHTSTWSHNTAATVTTNATYFAQTTKAAVTRNITYNRGANVSATGKGSDSCNIGATFNGVAQGTTCNVTLTTITPASGYLVDGFYEGQVRKGNVGASIALSGNVTYTANVGSVGLVLNSASATQMKVTASVSPASTPLAASAYQYNTANTWTNIGTTTSTTNTFSVNATSSYTLYVRVTDAKGNAVVKSVSYTNPSIGTPTTNTPKWNSLNVSVTATKGTANIAKYYFSSNNGTSFGSAVANTTTTGTTTLTGLNPSTTYSIKAYVEDTNGRRSPNSATGTGTTANYNFSKVKITYYDVTKTSVTIKYVGTNGTGTIKEYRLFVNGSQKETITNKSGTYEYTITSNITEATRYAIKLQAVDNEKYSNGNNITSTYSNEINAKTLYEKVYAYSGKTETFTAPEAGTYRLEVWGAQGGSLSNTIGGYGGYSTGEITLNKNEILYVTVGNTSTNINGGYNGGGAGGYGYSNYRSGVGGGGATHIATATGLLSSLSNNKSAVLIVAGGGGGANGWVDHGNVVMGGSGGGYTGGNSALIGDCSQHVSTGATNTSGYAFGQGQKGRDAGAAYNCGAEGNGGGGGGYYGGYSYGGGGVQTAASGAGGSGYINTSKLTNASMYCYNCKESTAVETRTVSVKNISNNPTSYYAKGGTGYARITLVDSTPAKKEYAYNNDYQIFTASINGNYKIELWGASGGNVPNYEGGKGAYTSGEIELKKNEILYVNVGGTGSFGTAGVIATHIGGYNGGGNGYVSRTNCTQTGASGGGATDVRLESGNLNSRIMVAAGGGGAYSEYCATTDYAYITGGSAGALSGYGGEYVKKAGYSALNPTGGTQTTGGQSVNDWTSTAYTTTYSGTFGKGATGGNSYSGGGGGYYGGASGVWQPGAGGSSYISGYTGCIAVSSSSSTAPKSGCSEGTQNISCSYHYSNKIFKNIQMLDGKKVMLNPSGTNETGHTGNGYARITLIELT